MKNQADNYYQAVQARDARFDGTFFIGVKTTGIYCRPICPAKPKRENVEFFPSAWSAERAGYRPCLRCRPECAPLSSSWIENTTLRHALELVAGNGYPENDEAGFAEELGISAGHLRRLFDEELGKTPKQMFTAHRLNFGRKLVVETTLPITEIALSSGFSSIRRFNDAFKERFHRFPEQCRRRKTGDRHDGPVKLTLSYRPPYDWNSIIQFYRSHEIGFVENVTSDSYERVFNVNGSVGSVIVTHSGNDNELCLKIAAGDSKVLQWVVENIRRMFDVDGDPILVEGHFSECQLMSNLCRKYPGLRLPRGWDPYEAAVCTILGQFVSTGHARALVRQLVECYGEAVKNPSCERRSHLFPPPERLAAESLLEVKTTNARKNTIREFSRLVAEGRISLSPAQDPAAFREQLLSIKGIGPWSAEYLSLRAMGDVDAFPGTDLILKRAVQTNPGLRIESFRPWRAYAALYLWKEFASALSRKKAKPVFRHHEKSSGRTGLSGRRKAAASGFVGK